MSQLRVSILFTSDKNSVCWAQAQGLVVLYSILFFFRTHLAPVGTRCCNLTCELANYFIPRLTTLKKTLRVFSRGIKIICSKPHVTWGQIMSTINQCVYLF